MGQSSWVEICESHDGRARPLRLSCSEKRTLKLRSTIAFSSNSCRAKEPSLGASQGGRVICRYLTWGPSDRQIRRSPAQKCLRQSLGPAGGGCAAYTPRDFSSPNLPLGSQVGYLIPYLVHYALRKERRWEMRRSQTHDPRRRVCIIIGQDLGLASLKRGVNHTPNRPPTRLRDAWIGL